MRGWLSCAWLVVRSGTIDEQGRRGVLKEAGTVGNHGWRDDLVLRKRESLFVEEDVAGENDAASGAVETLVTLVIRRISEEYAGTGAWSVERVCWERWLLC